METPEEYPQLTIFKGEQFRVSDCCFAEVINVVQQTHPTENYQSSHFVCQQCNQRCVIETSPRVVELLRQQREGTKDVP